MIRLIWKDKPPCDVPAEYPETPEEFFVKYPLWHATAYEAGPPVPSPVAWQVALMMYDQQPCRSTKGGCSPYMRSATEAKQLANYGWTSPPEQRMNQLQRAHHMQEMSFGRPGTADLPWLKICTPQRQVAVAGMQTAGVSPLAADGGVMMMDVNTGVGAVAGAPVLEPNAAAPAPVVQALVGVAASVEPNAAAPAPVGPEAAAVTPELVNGLAAIKDQELQLQPSGAKLQMHDVAKMLREKLLADKVEAARKREALKDKEKASRCT